MQMTGALSIVFLPAVSSLVCYSCFSEVANSSCQLEPRSVHWVECDGLCQVWHLYSEADSRSYMFERSCSGLCSNGCTQLADMEHRFVGCSSCCSTDFCNVGKGSFQLTGSAQILMLVILFYTVV